MQCYPVLGRVSALWAAAALLLLAPARIGADPAADLNGFWLTDTGEEVKLEHDLATGRVKATFTARAGDGACPLVKPPDDRRSFWIDGVLQNDALAGKMMRCTQLKAAHLVEKCGASSAYETTFHAPVVTPSRISGTYATEDYKKQPPDPNGCEYAIDPGKGRNVAFAFERCGSNPAGLCKALSAARVSADRFITLDFHSPSADEWSALVAKERPRLAADLDQLAAPLCGEADAQTKLDELKALLPALDASGQTLLEQRRKAASIDLGLEELQKSRCAAVAAAAGPCQPLSLRALDAMQAYMKRVDEAKPKLVSEEDGYKQVGEGLKEALEQLQDEARSARDGPSTVGDLDQYLEEHDRKIGKLKELLGYWEQVKAASCVPSGVLELLRKLAREQKSGIEHEATCTELCGETADWIVEMTGDPRQRKTLFQGCVGACN